MLITKYKTKDITNQLNKLEEKLGCTLPQQYRQFLIDYNGGELWFTTIEIPKYRNSIRYFYGFVKVSEYHSINNKYVKQIQKEFLTPQEVLGIAELEGGDVLAIGIGPDNNGEMFYSNHDEGYKAFKISNSFKDLLQTVKSKPVDKSTIKHPEQTIKEQTARKGRKPSETMIKIYWQQYNDLLNLEQEEVVIRD